MKPGVKLRIRSLMLEKIAIRAALPPVAEDQIQIRALLEFSNHCRRMCQYCGLNRTNTALPRFRLEPGEILETALEAVEAGYRTVVLQVSMVCPGRPIIKPPPVS